LYCDLICLDDDGSVLDVAVLSLMTALKSLKLPKVEYEKDTKVIKVDDKIKIPLKLKCLPISSTFALFENEYLLANPTADEENISDSLVTISTCNGEFNYVYKPGGNALKPEQFEQVLKEAVRREKYVKSLMDSIFNE
jgi:exosome complex component RRP43